MVIKFSVKEQTISLLPTKSIPRIGSKDYLILQFVFSNDWDRLSKVVYLQKDSVSEPIELVGDTLKVPEWFTEQDTFNVTLLGVGDTQEVPTNVVSIKLEKSNTLWNEDAPVPQPSWLVTVLEAAKRVEEAVVNPPKIGENGNWFVWDFDAGMYVDTGRYAGGIVPHIGENGNWFIGTEDSGVPATGPRGEQGVSGVYCGVEEPDAEYDVWVDPSGTPDLPGTGGFPVVEIENTITEAETPLTEAQNALISELIGNNMPFLLKLHIDHDFLCMNICSIAMIISVETVEGAPLANAAVLEADTLTVKIMDGYIHVQGA